jgi:hypothetical protein
MVRGEQIARMLESSSKDRYKLAQRSVSAVQEFYEQAYQDCRLVYNRLPSPRKMQTLVQVWKQLRKWR